MARSRLTTTTHRWLAGLLAGALVLGACTSDEAEPTSGADGTTEDEDTVEPADPTAAEDDEPHLGVQDLWTITRMQAVAEDGTTTDVVVDVLEELRALAGEPVQLIDELAFRPLPDLAPMVVTATGEPRTDVEVTAGLLEVTGTPDPALVPDDGAPDLALTLLSTTVPGATTNVAPGDHLSLEIFGLEALAGHDVVLVDYAFGQSVPFALVDGEAPVEEADDTPPLERLGRRWRNGQVRFGAPEEGPDNAVSLVTGVPLQRTDDTIRTAVELADDGDGGGGGGLMPAKARGPIAGALASTLVCLGVGMLAGPAGGVVVTVVCTAISAAGILYTLEDILDDNDPAQPPGCEEPCGKSSGDPHVRTFDGRLYSIHAAGEFTAVRGDDGLEVQARLVPVGQRLAANSAVAADVAGTRVEVDARGDDLLLVDGAPLALEEFEGHDLDGGGHVRRHGGAVVVIWPDDTRLWVELRRDTLDYRVSIAPERAGAVSGFLGDADGDRSDDLVHADGQPLEDPSDPEQFRAFVDSWRIEQARSLFTYAEGESTATHTDLDFPPPTDDGEPADAATRRWARSICGRAGLVEGDLEDCIVDLAATGDTSYLLSAWESQALHNPDGFTRRLGVDTPYGRLGLGAVDAEELRWLHPYDDRALLEPKGGQLVAGEGLVLVRVKREDGPLAIEALDTTDGELRWDLYGVSPCRPVITPTGTVVAIIDDDARRLVAVDAATGRVQGQLTRDEQLRTRDCGHGMTSTDEGLVVFVEGRTIQAVDTRDGLQQAWHRTFEDARPLGWAATAGDRIYVLLEGEATSEVHRLDAATGETRALLELPFDRFERDRDRALVALTDGRLAVLGHPTDAPRKTWVLTLLEDDGDGLRRDWSTEFSEEATRDRPPSRLRQLDELLVGWSGDEVIAVDLATGALAWIYDPSSFENNKGAIAATPDVAVVAPFSGDWLEAVDASGRTAWRIRPVRGLGGPVQLGPVVDGHLLVAGSIQSDAGGGAYVGAVAAQR